MRYMNIQNNYCILQINLHIYNSMAKKYVNKLKIMLAVTKHTNKWLAEMLDKDQASISKMVYKYLSTRFGNFNTDF